MEAVADPNDADGPDPASPWAGDVPVPSRRRVEFSWSTPASGEPEWSSGPGGQPPHRDGGDGHQHDDDADPSRDTGRAGGGAAWQRRHRLGIGVAAVVAVVALVGVFSTVGNDSAQPATDEPTVTDFPLPSDGSPTTVAADTLDEIADPADEPEVEPAESGTTTEAAPSNGASDGSDGDTATGAPMGVWVDQVTATSSALRALSAEMTLVAVSADDVLREIHLPSGRVRAVQLPNRSGNAEMVVGTNSTLLVLDGDGLLVRAGDPVVEVTLDAPPPIVQARPSRDEYRLFTFGTFDGSVDVRVLPDGSTIHSEIVGGQTYIWRRQFSPAGTELINDAGGVYEIADDGSTDRVSDGELISASSHHLLFRECDELYRCVYVVEDFATGVRTVVEADLDPLPLLDTAAVQVAPDGTFLRYLDFVASTPREVLLDVVTGDRIVMATRDFATANRVWSADSSGVFRLAPTSGLQFVNRETGEVSVFAEEFGPIRSFGVRLDVPGVGVPDAPGLDTGLEIVGLGRDGEIHRIGIDAGPIVSAPVLPLASGAPAVLVPDADGVTIISLDNVPSVRFDDADGATSYLKSSRPGGSLIPATANTMWEPIPTTDDDQRVVLALVDALGQPLGPVIDVGDEGTVTAIGGDGLGAVIVKSDVGGIFALTADTVEQITDGEILAIGPGTAYVRECDDQLTCGVFRVDRVTGERQRIEIDELSGAGADEAAGGPLGQNVSPDGDVVLVRAAGYGTAWAMVETTTGARVPIPGVAAASPIVWTPDSRYALFLSGDVLRVYDRDASGLRSLDSLPDLKAFALVPPDVATPVAVGELRAASNTVGRVEGPAPFPF